MRLWKIQTTDLHGLDEVIDVPTETILIDTTRYSEEWMRAHVRAHEELGHLNGPGGSFSPLQEEQADALAEVFVYGISDPLMA